MFEYYYFNFNIYSFIQRKPESKQGAQEQSLVWKICAEGLTIEDDGEGELETTSR